jgi:hypothetical protein
LGRVDSKITSNLAKQYKPAEPRLSPTFSPSKDVTVIICTLDPPKKELAVCLYSVFINNPKEIIISTTKPHLEQVLRFITKFVNKWEFDRNKITVTADAEQGIRTQLKAAIEKAKGSVIATCNDSIVWAPTYLTYMLACLEDPKVGAVSPPIVVGIPDDRMKRDVITVWEVAGTKLAYRGPGSGTSMHVAAKWCWILSGATGVYRAEILQNKDFLHAFTNDYWRGKKLDVGDDTFISRWLLKHGKSQVLSCPCSLLKLC